MSTPQELYWEGANEGISRGEEICTNTLLSQAQNVNVARVHQKKFQNQFQKNEYFNRIALFQKRSCNLLK